MPGSLSISRADKAQFRNPNKQKRQMKRKKYEDASIKKLFTRISVKNRREDRKIRRLGSWKEGRAYKVHFRNRANLIQMYKKNTNAKKISKGKQMYIRM